MTPETRAARLWAIFAVFFALILVNLFRMQILQGDDFKTLSEKNRIRVRLLEAPRGRILDRKGQPLADSRLSFNCSLFPQEARKHLDSNFAVLAPILDEEVETLRKRFLRGKPGQYGTVLLAEDIRIEQAMAIEERMDQLAGVLVETRPIREYPLGPAAGHLTGYTGPQTDAEKEMFADAGYGAGDWVGKTGLEAFYETYLHGKSGGLQMEVNSRGRLVRALGVREPQEGKDLTLALDADLQEEVYRLIDGRRAAVVVLDARDGGVLAMVSSPSYDPNRFASSAGRKTVDEYFQNEHSPMLNRVVQSAYPLGSVFKIVTAMAGFEQNKIDRSTRYHCPGHLMVGGKRFGCWKKEGHGSQDMLEGMAHSCDVYFYRTGLGAGVDAVRAMARVFGFDEKTGVDVPGERKGHVPSKDWKKRKLRAAWFEGDMANLAIGQGYLQVTPIQAAVSLAASGTGHLVRPHVVQKIDGVPVVSSRPGWRLDVSTEDLDWVRKGLVQVVHSDTGTGKLSRIPGVTIAAKTGTAETGPGRPNHAWYAGYAPADDPQVALCVFLEYGGHGGVEAASVARGIWTWLKNGGYLGQPAKASP